MDEGISELQRRISSDETRFHGRNRATAFSDENLFPHYEYFKVNESRLLITD